MGDPTADWRAPWPEPEEGPRPWSARQAEDLRWVRDHVLPFVRRRLRGAAATGPERMPKRPTLAPFGADPA